MALRAYTPAEFRQISGQLANVYSDGERHILQLLSQGNLTDWKEAFLKEQLQQVQEIIAGLNDATTEWAGVHIPAVYEHNLQYGAQVAGLDPTMTAIHQEQVALIQHSVTSKLDYANGGIGRGVEDAYRQASLEALKQGMVGGATRAEVSKDYLGKLRDKGITSFVDKSGRSWDMTTYAEMVARTNTMEASKTATSNQMLDAGMDLAMVSTHDSPCEKCAPYEGVTLSISGNTDGYQSVDDAVAESGHLFGPNCLHDLLPIEQPTTSEGD